MVPLWGIAWSNRWIVATAFYSTIGTWLLFPPDWRAIVFQKSTAKFLAPFTQYEISIYGLYMRAYQRLVVPLNLWEISVAHQRLECKPPPLERKGGHSFIADVIYDSVVECVFNVWSEEVYHRKSTRSLDHFNPSWEIVLKIREMILNQTQ
jgi:hypothetical protein